MKVYSYERPATVGLISMFFFSGVAKVFVESARNFDIKRINRIPFLKDFSFWVVIFAGIFEIFSTSVIIQDLFFDEKSKGRLSKRSEQATVSLILFTIIATLTLYVYPVVKFRALMSNISIISGLLFVFMIIKRNTVQNVEQNPRKVSNAVIQRVNETLETLQSTESTRKELEAIGILEKGKSAC